MVAGIRSDKKAVCSHLKTVALTQESTAIILYRICPDCGEKACVYRVTPPRVLLPGMFRRPEELVTYVSKEAYLAIEKSFDVRTPEYRDRVFQLLEEAIKSRAVSLGEVAQVIKNHEVKD